MSDPTSIEDLVATVDGLLTPIRGVSVIGDLNDWRIGRHGNASGDLTTGDPPTARIRITAGRHAAHAAAQDLDDAGRTGPHVGLVLIHGHLAVHPRWGLHVGLLRLECLGAPVPTHEAAPRPNRYTTWPRRVLTIGLIAPDGGDDAYADVICHCQRAGVTLIEHRVAVTGRRAPIIIGHALDRLALDPRPDITLLVRGGGPNADFAPYNSTIITAAIDRHPRPVVTGLGHATHRSRADEAAHTACTTPTAAAMEAIRRHDGRAALFDST